jgi:hypothetical protein
MTGFVEAYIAGKIGEENGRRSAQAGADFAARLFGVAPRQHAPARQQVFDQPADLASFRQQIADLQFEVMRKSATLAGVRAQVRGFITAHPDSPERAGTGEYLTSGNAKRVTLRRFEQAHDAFLAANGIANPERYRAQ